MGNDQVLHHYVFIVVIMLCNFHTQCRSQFNLSSSTDGSHFLCRPEVSRALLQFKSHFMFSDYCTLPRYSSDDTQSKTWTWNENTDCCSSWEGVTCNVVTGEVIGLDLSCSSLTSRIQDSKAESNSRSNSSGIFSSLFASMPNLQKLDLGECDLNMPSPGQFSLGFASLSSLTHLVISGSFFSGGYVPSDISHLSKLVFLSFPRSKDVRFKSAAILKSMAQNLTQLRVLNLEHSSLLALPDSASSLINLSSSVTALHLSDSGLQGTFPESFLLLPNLEELDLSMNSNLSGSLPKSSNSPSLKVLRFFDTGLSGELPADSIGNLKSLQVVDLGNCNFSGSIPSSLGNLTQITQLDLSDNHFSGAIPSSIGSIPASIGNLKSLQFLGLRGCNFSGSIPASIGNLQSLQSLDLTGCSFSGPIPASLGNLTQITRLDLGGNHFSGAIPSSIGYLNQLDSLDLSGNTLRGQLPNAILNLTGLTTMDLSSNQLEGSLPASRAQPFPYLKAMDISENSLNGTIPSWLFALPSLEYIRLYNNHLSGPLSEFTSPSLEELDLSNNELNGSIPKPISRSVDLLSLDLSHNFLTGSVGDLPDVPILDLHFNSLEGSLPVPTAMATYFSVSNNSFTGEVPSLICNASSLEVLDWSFNNLSGMIPHCLGNVSFDLSVLNLCMNNFHGTIPDTFAKGSQLTYLNLNGNQLGGVLPRSLLNCEYLEALDLDNNSIVDVFPAWMGKLKQLKVVVLRSNKFHGRIDIDLHMSPSFPMLQILDLSNNNFSGSLPSRLITSLKGMINVSEDQGDPEYMGSSVITRYEYSVTVTMKGVDRLLVKILTLFTTIDMSDNKFDGNIPPEFGNLHALKGLNLSHNYLEGPIPPSVGKLGNLEWLDLSSNKLVGRIPTQLADLNFLEVLNLSHNRLHGPIPGGKQFNTFGVDSYAGNSGLCGFPLPKCGNKNSNLPTQSASSDDESNSTFSWKSSYVGYGCGTIFGLAMGYLVFSTGSPQWLVKMVEGERQTRRAQRLRRTARARGRRARN